MLNRQVTWWIPTLIVGVLCVASVPAQAAPMDDIAGLGVPGGTTEATLTPTLVPTETATPVPTNTPPTPGDLIKELNDCSIVRPEESSPPIYFVVGMIAVVLLHRRARRASWGE